MMRAFALIPLTCVLTAAGCGSGETGLEVASEDGARSVSAAAASQGPTSANVWCPAGAVYDAVHRLCVKDDEALGPFPSQMIKRCVEYGGGEKACHGGNWSADFARALRGTDRCPEGSSLHSKKGYCVEGQNVFGPFTWALVDRCRRRGGGAVCDTMRWHDSFVPDRPDVWCPAASDYDFDFRLCVSEAGAVGPFTSTMTAACKSAGGGNATCEGRLWDVALTRSLRGTGPCPQGSTLDTSRGYCVEGDNVFGPFAAALVSSCIARGGGSVCKAMRWHKSFVATQAPPEPSTPNPLIVPYYFQHYNAHEPGETCGITSAAMLLRYWGKSATPDDLYLSHGKWQGQYPEGLAQLYRAHWLVAHATRHGTRSMIKRHIDAGRPVVVHGYFTQSGHIVVIVGHNATGWIVNDPAGRWSGCVGCGYGFSGSTEGRRITYGYQAMGAALMEASGIWLSVASTGSFSL